MLEIAEGRIASSNILEDKFVSELEKFSNNPNPSLSRQEIQFFHTQDCLHFLRLLALDILLHCLFLTQQNIKTEDLHLVKQGKNKNNDFGYVWNHNFYDSFIRLNKTFKDHIEACHRGIEHIADKPADIPEKPILIKEVFDQLSDNYKEFRYPHQKIEFAPPPADYELTKKFHKKFLYWLIDYLTTEIKAWIKISKDQINS